MKKWIAIPRGEARQVADRLSRGDVIDKPEVKARVQPNDGPTVMVNLFVRADVAKGLKLNNHARFHVVSETEDGKLTGKIAIIPGSGDYVARIYSPSVVTMNFTLPKFGEAYSTTPVSSKIEGNKLVIDLMLAKTKPEAAPKKARRKYTRRVLVAPKVTPSSDLQAALDAISAAHNADQASEQTA